MATSQRYATFFLNGICFGVHIEKVQEVLDFQEITPVPLSSAVLPGIINLRGQILTTIDLQTRLGLAASESKSQPMMIVIRTSEGPINLLVDRIGSVRDVDPALFEKPTETLKPGVRAVTTHFCKLEEHLLLVLDTEKIILQPTPASDTNVPVSAQKLEKEVSP
jgi:purine-binding chemotaxis protein CheW